MNEVDLHGLPHKEAGRVLEGVINELWCSDTDLCIITGNSPKLQGIVIDILTEYTLEYMIGDFSGMNMGFIRTHLD